MRGCLARTSARLKIPDGLPDEKVVFSLGHFSDWVHGAENCNIQQGDTVAIWGCGPVAQFAIRSAFMLGAERVIAVGPRSGAAANGAGRRRGDHQLRGSGRD